MDYRRRGLRYLDPGTGSMLIQLVVGFVVGVLLAVKSYWKKIKKKVKKYLLGREPEEKG